VATRLLPICDYDGCMHEARCKLAHATLPGVRVFFRINGTIAVYESENDAYKLVFDGATGGAAGGGGGGSGGGGSSVGNDDFAFDQEPPLILYDQFGIPFALPPRVANKAHALACHLMPQPQPPPAR
jgi:hypothetical protein